MPDVGAGADSERMQTLMKRFEIPLVQFATQITGDRERAKDVVQETFVKFQRNGALSQQSEPVTWLFTVCRNGALNVCRKEKRMMYLDEEMIESREDKQPMHLRATRAERGGWLFVADCGDAAATAAGGHPTQISK